jgi:hypothetical protein
MKPHAAFTDSDAGNLFLVLKVIDGSGGHANRSRQAIAFKQAESFATNSDADRALPCVFELSSLVNMHQCRACLRETGRQRARGTSFWAGIPL